MSDRAAEARAKIARAREQGGPLLEAIVRGHGCCMVNDPEFDQALWDKALAERWRLRVALERYLNEAPDHLKPIARAALEVVGEQEAAL